jgi:hypothetical protein
MRYNNVSTAVYHHIDEDGPGVHKSIADLHVRRCAEHRMKDELLLVSAHNAYNPSPKSFCASVSVYRLGLTHSMWRTLKF